MADGGILAYIWLGAEHMLTGYDHLLFLFGVIFFLTGFRDVVRFITAFTLGHCITLLGATLLGITANAYVIDAIIALSVIYKGFENLDGFKKILNRTAPNLLAMVFLFGLIHGFGLSTRLQELPLGDEGLVSRILAFNVGVELGQVVALTVMLGFFKAWRSSKSFQRFDALSNGALVLAGITLFIFQVMGYFSDDHDHHAHGHDEDAEAHEHNAHPHTVEPTGHTHGAHSHTHEAEPSPGDNHHSHDQDDSTEHAQETESQQASDQHAAPTHSHGTPSTEHGHQEAAPHGHHHDEAPTGHSHGEQTHSHGDEDDDGSNSEHGHDH